MPGQRHIQLPRLANTGRYTVNDTDQYGLDWEVFGRFPERSRYYGSLALKHYGLPLNQNPGNGMFGSSGTFPEMIVIGMCLHHGFADGVIDGARSFAFQESMLGGRVPGGVVVDLMIYHGFDRIAVRVESVFHGLEHPHQIGGQKVEEDRRQAARMMGGRFISRVVNVNRVVDGHPLENGPDYLVERDWLRILGRA